MGHDQLSPYGADISSEWDKTNTNQDGGTDFRQLVGIETIQSNSEQTSLTEPNRDYLSKQNGNLDDVLPQIQIVELNSEDTASAADQNPRTEQPVADDMKGNLALTKAPEGERLTERIQTAARLLCQVHAGEGSDVSRTLKNLTPEDARAVARYMTYINAKAERTRGWFDDKVPAIHVNYKKDAQGDIPTDVRLATEAEAAEVKLNSSLLKCRQVPDQFIQDVMEGIAGLPKNVRQLLKNSNYTYVAADRVTDVIPGQTAKAVCDYSSKQLVLGTRAGNSDDQTAEPAHGVRHEGAHAIDHLFKNFSSQMEFQTAVQKDLALMSKEDRQYLDYIISAGNAEIFAEVFASRYGLSKDSHYQEIMNRNFPEVARLIRAAIAKIDS